MNTSPAIRVVSCLLVLFATYVAAQEPRPRVRDLGVTVGILPTGEHNAITDVAGVKVGHTTLVLGESIRTGVTAIVPHGGNLFEEKVPGAVHVGNGFGKLMGSTQVEELGEIETPILLTSTLNVPRVADAVIDWMLKQPGSANARSINVLVGETNDGVLNDIQGRHCGRREVYAALAAAKGGPVEEGCVGAGTGTICFGFKGGIGTSSRVVPKSAGGYTVGVLVQTNFGGVLSIAGTPVGKELGQYYLKEELERERGDGDDSADGSILMVVATDAPLDARNLKRLAARAMLGLARTGSPATNGSGDYVIAFSTHERLRITSTTGEREAVTLGNDSMSPLFLAVVEATEEAIYNSLTKATTTTGRGGRTVEALPIERVVEILKRP